MNRRDMSQYRDAGLLIIRIGLGFAFLCHGWPKLMAGPHGPGSWEALGNMANMPAPVVAGFIGAVIEVLGGILLAIGGAFRITCMALFLQMMVALFLVHIRHHDKFSTYSHALEDGIVFLGLFLIGPGKHSVDGR